MAYFVGPFGTIQLPDSDGSIVGQFGTIKSPGTAAQSIQPTGIATAEAFGDASVSGGTQPVPADFYFIAADSALLQPELLIPGRRPVEPAGINRRHKYAQGLVGAFLLNDDTNLVDGVTTGTLEGDAYIDPARGLVLDGIQQDEYFRFGANFRNTLAFGTDDFVIVVGATYGGDQNDFPTLISNGFNDAGEWVLAYDSILDRFVFLADTSSIFVAEGITIPGLLPGQAFTLAVCRTGDTLKLYYDGEYEGQDTSAGADLSAVNDYAGLGISEAMDTADRYWNGAINFAFVWRAPNIGHAEDLIWDITRDPYQILKPAADAPLMMGIPGGAPRTIRPAGVVSAETFGAHALAPGAVSLLPAGIASAEAHGAQIIVPGVVSVDPAGIVSAEAFGSPAMGLGSFDLLPAGIPSAESHGATILDVIATLAPAAIPSAEALGDAGLLPGAVAVDPAGIAGAEAFGSALISPGLVQILAQGIASAEALGTAIVTRGTVSIDPAGIVSAEAFGTAGVLSGGALIAAFGIDSAEAVGALVIQPGTASVIPSGIVTGEAFGAHDIAHSAILLAPSGIASGEWFGDTLIIPQLTVIEPAGVVTGEAFGTLTLLGGAQLLGWLMAEIQARAALEGSPTTGVALDGVIDTPSGLGADIRINWDG